MQTLRHSGPTTRPPCLRRTHCAAWLLAAALAVPGTAHPFALDALLGMPLEQLLQLRATARGTTP